MNKEIPAAIMACLAKMQDQYIKELTELCAIECPTSSKAGVDQAGAWVQRWVARHRWPVEVHRDATVGDSLVISVPGGAPDKPAVLLAAHLDTVYPVGTAAERPLRQVGPKLVGPGSCDNKSGLLSALYAAQVLIELGLRRDAGPITIVCGSDEETDMRASLAVLRALVPQHTYGLVLEAGRENGDIVGARKGGGQFIVAVTGKAAHAGVEPHKGANAILALAQQTVALHLLNGMRPGVTLNVGVVSGGSVSNAVPDQARAEVDVRIIVPEDAAPVEAAIRQVVGTTYVPGTSTTLSGGWGAPPMARTPQIGALAERAVAAAALLGFSTNAAATGGVSYANYLAAAGLPVLDGLGPVGGLDHSPEEYIVTESIVPRTALLTLLLLAKKS